MRLNFIRKETKEYNTRALDRGGLSRCYAIAPAGVLIEGANRKARTRERPADVEFPLQFSAPAFRMYVQPTFSPAWGTQSIPNKQFSILLSYQSLRTASRDGLSVYPLPWVLVTSNDDMHTSRRAICELCLCRFDFVSADVGIVSD